MTSPATVFVIDDDAGVLQALEDLCGSVNLDTKCYASAEAYLSGFSPSIPGCLVLDLRMPGMSGLDLQAELRRRNCRIPIIFLTGHGDPPAAVRAMKNGALDFIEKPFRNQELLDRVHCAIETDARLRVDRAKRAAISERFSAMTPRECQVVDMIVGGMTSKLIAARLGVSTQAIDAHRSRAMRKLGVDSIAALTQLAISRRLHDHEAVLV